MLPSFVSCTHRFAPRPSSTGRAGGLLPSASGLEPAVSAFSYKTRVISSCARWDLLTSHKDANCSRSSFSANAGSLPRPRGGAGGLLEFGRSSLVLWLSEIAPGGSSPAYSPGSRKRKPTGGRGDSQNWAVAWDVLLSCSLGEMPPAPPALSRDSKHFQERVLVSLPSFISQEEVLGPRGGPGVLHTRWGAARSVPRAESPHLWLGQVQEPPPAAARSDFSRLPSKLKALFGARRQNPGQGLPSARRSTLHPLCPLCSASRCGGFEESGRQRLRTRELGSRVEVPESPRGPQPGSSPGEREGNKGNARLHPGADEGFRVERGGLQL